MLARGVKRLKEIKFLLLILILILIFLMERGGPAGSGARS
jgi:hypothetical protein